jgi:hypothetical protein
MNIKSKEIITSCVIGNQQKQVTLSKIHPGSNGYDIFIDKNFEGQIIRLINGWEVSLHKKSRLQGENSDSILQAVLNIEDPNS